MDACSQIVFLLRLAMPSLVRATEVYRLEVQRH